MEKQNSQHKHEQPMEQTHEQVWLAVNHNTSITSGAQVTNNADRYRNLCPMKGRL